jgi:hypothetical protein
MTKTIALPPDRILRELPIHGIFTLYFNNRRRRGFQVVKELECQGTLYDSRHVHLDTTELRVNDFANIAQMFEFLQDFGDCALMWLEEVHV